VNRSLVILCTAFLILALGSCNRKRELPATLDSHSMVYDINYLEKKAGDVPTHILPNRMEAYYTRYFVLTSIEGFFNQFTLKQVADLRRRRVTTMLTFFGNKVYCTSDPGELPAGIIDPGEMDISETGETSAIGGLNSMKLDVRTGSEQFHIYYTEDFTVRRPNISTPYHSVDYPLTDFRIQLSHLKMHLTCTKYTFEPVESEIFEVPSEFKPVSCEAMEEIINSLFTKE